ncbi:MAG TPA: arginine--tRNA ligase [Thermoplasmata archaeon]|nr:arginine--tRNA ligase [Thermoplasmata archaeon]
MTEATAAPSDSTDPWAPFVASVVASLADGLTAIGVPAEPSTISAQLNLDGGPQGDVAFPVHRFAGSSGLTAPALAERLVAALRPAPEVSEVHATGAYLNFRADTVRLTERTLRMVLDRGSRYGHADGAGIAACVEHTSANATGPFHIGRVRNAIIGDTLARTLRAAGTPVTTHYYIDDLGRQAAMITWIWSKPRDQWPPEIRAAVDGLEVPGEKVDSHRGRPYPAASAYLKTHPEAQAEVAAIVQQTEAGSPPPQHRVLTQAILDGMLESLARLNIRFDEFVWESDFLRDGSVERVLERLHSAPHALREENGAWAIDTSTYGLPKESKSVVVQRGDGTSLYVTRDVAYHLSKFGRFQRVVDVLGQDHRLHARTLEALLAEIGETRRPEFVIYQDITVPDGGRMSTRGGSAVWLDHLLAEAVERARKEVLLRREDLGTGEVEHIAEAVATGAVRYHIVRVASEKPVVFRWEDALSFEGRSGPFCQYSYVRAVSVLRKAEATQPPYLFDAARLVDPEEAALVRVIARLPRTVQSAARRTHVHALAGYAHDLADQFNRFYHAVPVLRSGDERPSRVALVAAVRQTLGNALDLLGVPRLEAM